MRMAAIVLSSVLVGAVAFLTGPAPVVHAQVPVPPIVFDQPNTSQPDGPGMVSFTNAAVNSVITSIEFQNAVDPEGPVWSKDGQRLAARAVAVGTSAQRDIFVFDPSGGTATNISHLQTPSIPCGAASKPLIPWAEAFSGDGSTIAYTVTEQCYDPVTHTSYSDWALLATNIASGQTTIIGIGTWTANEGIGVDWSPKQDLITVPQSVLDLNSNPPTSVTAIFAGPSGAGQLGTYHQVTHPPGQVATLVFDQFPSISRDGQHVAFVRWIEPAGGTSTIRVMTADITGANEQVVAGPFTNEAITHVDWSPDGTKLVFDRGTFNPPSIGGSGLWLVNSNATGLTKIVDGTAWMPAWASAPALERVAALPALSNGAYGGYLTTAYIENLGHAPADVRIEYFDRAGNRVGAGDTTANLPPRATWTVPQNNGHAFPAGGAGSAIISSSQPIAAFVNEFAPNNGDATSYTSIRIPEGTGMTLYAPAIASHAYGGYSTGLGIINEGDAPTTITITYRGTDGATNKTQTFAGVAAHAYLDVYSGDVGGANDAKLPAGFAGTATIQSGGPPLAAVVNEVGPGNQFSSYDAVAGGSGRLILPVALNNAFGGYHTGVGVQDVGGAAGQVSITYYDQAGTAVKAVGPLALAANGYLPIYQGDPAVGPPPSDAGYTAVLSSTDPIAAIVNEVGPASGASQQSTSYNTFAGGAATANLPLVESAGADGWSTGLGIMNTGSTATTVTVTYVDATTGAPVGTPRSQLLAPNAFWGLYQPTGGLPAGDRASAQVTTSGGTVAVICNEQNATSFMSYDGE